MLITSIILIVMLKLRKNSGLPNFKEAAKISGIGLLLAIHWVFFYGSIKASNVSVGVVCFTLIGFFTAVFEPLTGKRKPSIKELGFSFLTLFGIILIFSIDTQYRTGIILGIISSALAALFTIANKSVTNKRSSIVILCYEITGGFLLLTLLMPIYLYFIPVESYIPTNLDILWLVIFSLFCTIAPHILQLQALRQISAFTLNLSFNLEPIYSIILAILIFNESKTLNAAFYGGLLFIVLSVFLQTYSTSRASIKLQKTIHLID